jgi:hypothetical protein
MFKLRHIAGSVLILGSLLICPFAAQADQSTPFQVSLFHPAQLFADDYSVDGFRFNLIYGVNADVKGIDLGIVNESESAHGFELGLDNRVAHDFGGGQFGLFNEVKRDFNGVQIGLIANITGRSCQGFQASIFYNNAELEMHGLQLGIVNHAGSLQGGVQIGIINFNDDERYKGFMPFLNASF